VTVTQDDREQSAISDTSTRHIIFIETVIEKLDVMTIWRIEDGEPLKMQRIIWKCHLFSPPVVLALPNAGAHLLPEAAVQRTLEAVSSRPWLG
jgi:hypothetical protein